MNFKKVGFLLALTLPIASCSIHNPATHSKNIPALEEQCQILNKKSHSTKNHKSKRNSKENKRNYNTPSYPIFLRQEISLNDTPLNAFSKNINISYPQIPSIENIPNHSSSQLQISSNHKELHAIPSLLKEKEIAEVNCLISESSILTDRISIPSHSNERTESNFIPVLVAASGLLSIFLLGAAQRRSKEISRWASQNPWKTRGIITGTHITTALCAITLGSQLSEQGILIPDSTKYLSFFTIGTAIILYPSSHLTKLYLQRKIYDAVLFTSGAAMMMYIGNQSAVQQQNPANQNPIYSFIGNNQGTSSYVKENISIPKITPQDPPAKKSTGAKIALTVLAIVVFAALGYGLAALSCSIACSGNEALAAVVGIGGGIGLILLFIATIKSIFGKGKKNKLNPKSTEA
jgi:hypothetical protein